MNSKVLFEVTEKTGNISLLLAPAVLFLFGVATIWMEKRKIGYVAIKGIGYVVCVVSLLVTIVFASWAYLDRMSAANILRTGAYAVVAGKVEHFQPMPYEGHVEESFSVAGHRFGYSDFVASECFNNTTSHGGPIREGLSVRIAYVDNCILRIEELPGPSEIKPQ